MQFGAVLLVISGITLFAYVDGFESSNIVGVVLSVGSAFGAALYKVSACGGVIILSPNLAKYYFGKDH